MLKNILLKSCKYILRLSLEASNKQRGEAELKRKLADIVPDLSDQYTTYRLDMSDSYMVENVRCQHCFQVSTTLKAIDWLLKHREDDREITIVDIGDSSGTHIQYLKPILDAKNLKLRTLSVNIDETAVAKIRRKGLEAVQARAEDLGEETKADIFLSFEMLEHLLDPISFLHNMATKAECDLFVLTVPYVRRSRIGLEYVRNKLSKFAHPEDTHIFELSPEDWNLVFKFSGWEVVYSDKYTQYPQRHLLGLTRYLWRKLDFEGFYGVGLRRNLNFADKYTGW